MSSKHKLIGRIVFAPDPSKSQVYWKCPARGCSQIHYFTYVPKTSGVTPVYTKTCELCKKPYTATLLNSTGTSAFLAAVFNEEE